jgi:hypothetical protein
MTEYAPHPGHNCPRCNSPHPHLHPSVQFEGEVETCPHEYHLTPTNQNRQQSIDLTLEKRARLAQEGGKS